jgi:glycosyltransferase involved in cell wall biosynthesis
MASTSKRVLIVDFSPRGHHPFYVRLLLESGLAQVAQIVLAGNKEMFRHPAIVAAMAHVPVQPFQLGVEARAENAPLHAGLPDRAGVIFHSWWVGKLYRKVYRAVARSAPVDFVIVPYLDDCLLGLATTREAFGGTPWLAITMRTMFHYRDMGVMAPEQSFAGLRRSLAYRILRQHSTAAVLTIDPTLAEFAAGQADPLLHKIRYVPDPATRHEQLPSKSHARQRLGITDDARVVLLYGAVSERKGAALLVKAAASTACSERIHLLIAGKYWEMDALQNSDAWLALAARRRIHPINGFVDDELERLILAAADCMWVGYIGFYGVSSVMALAGRHAMPVLASSYGLVGHFTRQHQLGAMVDPHDQSSIVAALNRLVNEPEFFQRAGSNGSNVYERHSPIELQRLVVETVTGSWGASASVTAALNSR